MLGARYAPWTAKKVLVGLSRYKSAGEMKAHFELNGTLGNLNTFWFDEMDRGLEVFVRQNRAYWESGGGRRGRGRDDLSANYGSRNYSVVCGGGRSSEPNMKPPWADSNGEVATSTSTTRHGNYDYDYRGRTPGGGGYFRDREAVEVLDHQSSTGTSWRNEYESTRPGGDRRGKQRTTGRSGGPRGGCWKLPDSSQRLRLMEQIRNEILLTSRSQSQSGAALQLLEDLVAEISRSRDERGRPPNL
eukprot:g8912.t1